MTLNEATDQVTELLTTRAHRLVREEAVDVVGEVSGRFVAVLGLFTHRRVHDRTQIAR